MNPEKPQQIPHRNARFGGASARRELEEAFAPWRASVNRHLVLRSALDGLTWGALGGVAFVGGAWATHHHAWRWGGIACAAVGLIVGAARGVRRSWSDIAIALYVDGVLGTPETVTSAIALAADAPAGVIEEALDSLRNGERHAPAPARRVHVLALAATVACLAALAFRAPRPARAGSPTGTDIVKLVEIPGLDTIAQVEKLPAHDDGQRDRLAKIAEEARDLRKRLLEGMPRRDALDRLSKLKAKLGAERRELGSGGHNAGLTAAVGALKANGFPGLADALDERDMMGFDEMMERIANARETADREKAREALERAIEDAKKKGADDIARSLAKEKARLDDRSGKADLLRDLADGLRGTPGDTGRSGRGFDDKGTDGAGRQLADALRKGLGKLSPEERKRLAERLKERAESGGGKMSPKAKQKLKDLAKKLETPEGQKELEDELRDLANGDPAPRGEDEKRQEGLDDADDGADDLGRELGRDPKDKKGKGGGKDSKGGNGDPGDDAPAGPTVDIGGDPAGGAGGGGRGDHRGHTKKVDAETLKAKAKGQGQGQGPKPKAGATLEHAPGSDGASATVKGSGDLNGASADEVNGVDNADVPEPVRRQVKSYFE